DCLVLSEVLEAHGLSPKWLKVATGRSLSQVYRYLSGEATIPSLVWRALYAKTRDGRIIDVFVGEIPSVLVDLTCMPCRQAPSINDLVKARKKQIACEQEMLDILADGKVDRHDAKCVERLEREFSEMIRTQSQIYYAIKRAYERSRT
ncbi:MAG: hypothetical protein OEV87_13020, partial [Phycisphaerae bacterium]|nr:hypothetical protein [Phycisphaerae bacterium]